MQDNTDRLVTRIAALKAEREKGQAILADLEQRSMEVRESILRIDGAIQVLEEMLESESDDALE